MNSTFNRLAKQRPADLCASVYRDAALQSMGVRRASIEESGRSITEKQRLRRLRALPRLSVALSANMRKCSAKTVFAFQTRTAKRVETITCFLPETLPSFLRLHASNPPLMSVSSQVDRHVLVANLLEVILPFQHIQQQPQPLV